MITRIPTPVLRVYANREEARSWGRTARSHVMENFGSAGITRRLLRALGS